MSEDTCAICGEHVPEGRQVCPNCEKLPSRTVVTEGNLKAVRSEIFRKAKEGVRFEMQGDKNNPFYNSEGYPDPTAYGIIHEENELERKTKFLIKVLKFIINESGFELLNRIELRHKQSRKKFR